MCGVVGAIAKRDVISILMTGLKRLEYRGYDSAGIAVFDENQEIKRARAPGKVSVLEDLLKKNPFQGKIGLAHTRWATHGKVNERNAHPHVVGNRVVLVHNGIIENFESLRQQLQPQTQALLSSETDSEIVAAHIYERLLRGENLREALRLIAGQLEGAYAIGVMDVQDPSRIMGLRNGPPLVVGLGKHENFLASDVLALQQEAENFIYLEDNDLVELSQDRVSIYDASGKVLERKIYTRQFTQDTRDKAGFQHFMQKEIYEQPAAVQDTLLGCIHKGRLQEQTFGVEAETRFNRSQRIQIVACGTSYHAALIGRYWLEGIAKLPCQVEIASEFRYRKRATEKETLLVSISQSGETADTLAAIRGIQTDLYTSTLSICNVPESSLVRESQLVFMTKAGPEIGVCSTKGFITQLVALFLLSISLGKRRGLSPAQESQYLEALSAIPQHIEAVLQLSDTIKGWAARLVNKTSALFIGRGLQYPLAYEGALKLKEISYIHAEAYPAGELKHGALALVDKDMPVIALVPKDELLEKIKSNIEEVRTRGGELFLFADQNAGIKPTDNVHVIEIPPVLDVLAPLVYTIPLQLLAYHVAVLKGTDVDQPRNLAKSVTVE